MYYRVAIQVDRASAWQWKSTVLSSLDTLFQFLRLLRTLPHDQLRVFSSSSRESLVEQLEQENKGIASTSVTAAQFLSERMIQPPAGTLSSACEEEMSLEKNIVAAMSQQPTNEWSRGGNALEGRGRSVLERRREELETGTGGDHDLPYSFSLPLCVPQVLAWRTLLVKVQQGELLP